jgi:hypothetical protein
VKFPESRRKGSKQKWQPAKSLPAADRGTNKAGAQLMICDLLW